LGIVDPFLEQFAPSLQVSTQPGQLQLLQGIHPKVVSERLGHASVAITLNLYSHVLPSMQKDAAAALDRLLSN
jgi:hypothetical protein